ncbi:ABC transporter permease [Paenibacillus assamensis]|uniref:ABC transporter permease n=1 Tax=Paenibacillus assamensis TaxID=311244 RepID=UPI000404E1F9|nr:ABC transporter permease [Paenibacillus assamensis]
MGTYVRVLRVEFFKLRRSLVWLVVILAPVIMVLNGDMNFMRFESVLVKEEGTAWLKLYVQIVLWYSILLLPMSIGILGILMSRTEHADGSWKYLLSLPIPKSVIYMAKMTVLILLTGVSILLLLLGVFVSGKWLGIEEGFPYSVILVKGLLGWLMCWPIIAIQQWLSIRYPGIGIPMGISAATAIAGVLITNSQYAGYYLWSYPALNMLPSGEGFDVLSIGSSVGIAIPLFIVLAGLGLWSFIRRDVL